MCRQHFAGKVLLATCVIYFLVASSDGGAPSSTAANNRRRSPSSSLPQHRRRPVRNSAVAVANPFLFALPKPRLERNLVAPPETSPPSGDGGRSLMPPAVDDAVEVPVVVRDPKVAGNSFVPTLQLDAEDLKVREGYQFVGLHRDRNLAGASGTLYANYCRDLRICFDVDLDKDVSSVRLWGIWVFYQDYNYGVDGGGGSVLWVWGQNFKFNLRGEMDDAVSSVRFVGASNDYFADSVTFFSGENLKGNEYFVYADFPTFPGFDLPIRSAVLTGVSPWTIFEEDFYGGRRVCLQPGSNKNPAFFTRPSSLRMTVIRSARRGCDGHSETAPSDMIPQPNYFYVSPRLLADGDDGRDAAATKDDLGSIPFDGH